MAEVLVDDAYIGAGELYVDGELYAATMADNLWTVTSTLAAPKLNGLRGTLAQSDWIDNQICEIEVTPVEILSDRLVTAIPGAAATAQYADGVLPGGGLDTTLSGDSAVGATVINIVSATNLAVGDLVQIGPSGLTREFRKVTAINTLAITLEAALLYAHTTGDVVQEVRSTTLSADAAEGATNLKVASVTGLLVGDYVMVGYPGQRAIRELTSVGTTGAGGTGINFNFPLERPYRAGDYLWEVSNDGSTVIAPARRRLSDADYHAIELRAPGNDGRMVIASIDAAIQVNPYAFNLSDDGTKPAGPRQKWQSRVSRADTTAPQWRVYVTGPAS